MMYGQYERMRFGATSYEGRTQQWPALQIERLPGFRRANQRHARLQTAPGLKLGIYDSKTNRQRIRDNLKGSAVSATEYRAQSLMALNNLIDRSLKSGSIKWAPQTECSYQIKSVRMRLQLFDKPQALLRQ